MHHPATPHADTDSPEMNQVVCLCKDLTRRDILDHFKDPAHNYDTLVQATGVGTRCTACLLDLDLIVDEASGEHATSRVIADPRPQAAGRGWKLPIDQSNSGPFLNADGITTGIRIANLGPMFAALQYAVSYRYTLDLFANDGRHAGRRRGHLEPGGSEWVDFSSVAGAPPAGWFLFTLYPGREGLMGSIRPQVAIAGPHWVATFHTQYHAYACRGRAVLVQAIASGFNSDVHLINASNKACRIDFDLSGPDSDYRDTFRRTLPGRGAALQSLDEAFPRAPRDRMLSLLVRSDRPVRKHIVNRLQGGAISIDHFPNFK